MSFYQEYRKSIFDKSGGRCWYCGELLENTIGLSVSFTVDHVIPIELGGDDKFENLVPACRRCNIRKGTKSIEEFRWLLTRMDNDIPYFGKLQIDYLKKRGFVIYTEIGHKFWFEKIQDSDELKDIGS